MNLMLLSVNKDNHLTVGEVAKAANRSVQTIKRWEKQGKIPKAKRLGSNNWRVYTIAEAEDIVAYSNLLNTPLS